MNADSWMPNGCYFMESLFHILVCEVREDAGKTIRMSSQIKNAPEYFAFFHEHIGI